MANKADETTASAGFIRLLIDTLVHPVTYTATMFTVTHRVAAWAIFASFPSLAFSQAPAASLEQQSIKNAEGAQQPAKAGQETGSPHPVQLDAQHRPITAGGFVKSGPVVFEDDSEKAGLTKWTHKMGTPAKDFIV